jgi:hypothetical protein
MHQREHSLVEGWTRAKLKARSIEMVESLSNSISQGLVPSDQGMEECVEAFCYTEIALRRMKRMINLSP